MSIADDQLVAGNEPRFRNFYEEAEYLRGKYGTSAFADFWRSGQWNPAARYGDWNPYRMSDVLAGWQDNGDGDGIGDIANLALGTAGFGVGGVSGASAATGNGVTPQTLALDAAGLGAGAVAASALPALGLSTPAVAAPTAATAAPAAGGTLESALAGNAASGLSVAPQAASLESAITGASTAGGASGIVPGLATESAAGLGGGLAVPGVTGAGTTGALGAAGAGMGAGLASGLGSAAAGGTVAPAVAGTTGAAGTAAAAGAGGVGATRLSDVLNGNVGAGDLASAATLGDLGRILGTGALTLGSIYGNQQMADQYDHLARDYMALGAPSRQRYEESFSPNFNVNNLPGLQSSIDASTQSLLRGLSTQGNPYGNPGGLAEVQKYITGNVALPTLQNYRNQNAATGGFGAFSTAAPSAASASIGANGNSYADLGRGVSNILNPPTTLEQYMRSLGGGQMRSLT